LLRQGMPWSLAMPRFSSIATIALIILLVYQVVIL
jgi:hypothetical protein